jgi:hypothetical protein
VKPLRVFEAMTLFPKVKIWKSRSNYLQNSVLLPTQQLVQTSRPAQQQQQQQQQQLHDEKVAQPQEERALEGEKESHQPQQQPTAGAAAETEANVLPEQTHSELMSQQLEGELAEAPGSKPHSRRVLSGDLGGRLDMAAVEAIITGKTSQSGAIGDEDIGIRQFSWGDINLIRLAGMGSGGCVYKATLKVPKEATDAAASPRYVACKRFNRDALMANADARKGYLRELQVLTTLEHPSIMRLVGVAEYGPFVWHICEYIKFGSLADMLVSPRAPELPVMQRVRILVDIADALHFMHMHEPTLIHRDVKPSNILLTKDLRGKLSDFAYSRSISGPKKMTRCGTPAYVAPEVMLGQQYDESIDTYAFGVALWQVLTRAMPFAEENDAVTILKKTSSGERCEFPPFEECAAASGNGDLTAEVYAQYSQLAKRCWRQSSMLRPPMAEVKRLLGEMVDKE